MSERHEEALALLHDICDLFGIGADARSRDVILTNVQNAKRRSECLNRVEWEFFTTTETDEDGEEYEDCPLNWGANSQEYAEQFRGALATLKQETEARVLEMAINTVKDEQVEDTGHDGDRAYNMALEHAVKALERLSTKNLPTSPKSVEGMKLVPVEPTEAMLQAGMDSAIETEACFAVWAKDIEDIYRAMLQASPDTDLSVSGEVTRACNSCDWQGPERKAVMCGQVGPLCPECHETTDVIAAPDAPNDEGKA